MYYIRLVLQQVVNALDDAPSPEHNFVPHGHESVLHVCSQPVYKMYPPVKEILEKSLLDVPSVGKDLAIKLFGEDSPYPFIPVVNIRTCKTKCYDFPTVIAHQMQLEAVTPSHGTLPVRSDVLENLVGIAAQVMTHRYHRRVNETDSAALAKALNLHKEHHVEEHARHEFHKAVIRHGVRETAGQMLLYIKEVVVFEIGERAEMVANEDCHYLTLAQLPLTVAVPVLFSTQKKIFITF